MTEIKTSKRFVYHHIVKLHTIKIDEKKDNPSKLKTFIMCTINGGKDY